MRIADCGMIHRHNGAGPRLRWPFRNLQSEFRNPLAPCTPPTHPLPRPHRISTHMKTLRALFAVLTAALLMNTSLLAEDAKLYSVPLKDIDGKDTTLKAYEGKVILAVNVASRC